jgi:alpha-ribazole phosphatase
MDELWVWRHPKAQGAAGRCIGCTDLPVDPRRARRLAHRIRRVARQLQLPREVSVSPLRRCRDVGRWLRRWGWTFKVDARLLELDFGTWDGLDWSRVPWAEVEAWQADLLQQAPGGGESLARLAARVHDYVTDTDAARIVVTHGGWINALLHVPPGLQTLAAEDWPAPPRHGQELHWRR